MVRPVQEYGVRRNGNSLQLYRRGRYLGSVSLAWLCGLKERAGGFHTEGLSAQVRREGDQGEKGGSRTESSGLPSDGDLL